MPAADTILVFDVNETLLDLAALDARFARVFGDAGARHAWFGQLLQSALTTTVLGTYVDFGRLARTSLTVIADRRGMSLTDTDADALLAAMRRLPPHADVVPALARLHEAGFRMVALSNGTPDALADQLRHAGLAAFFEAILSVDAARRLKPAPEAYGVATDHLGAPPERLRLVAAHTWDVAGALGAGWRAAFVARPGKVPDPALPMPDLSGPDLTTVAAQILDTDSPT